jgi:hypothetical protein
MLTELVADQVAPAYWIPNKDVHVCKFRLIIVRKIIDFLFKKCSSCDLHFGSDYSKHHCRGLSQRIPIQFMKSELSNPFCSLF